MPDVLELSLGLAEVRGTGLRLAVVSQDSATVRAVHDAATRQPGGMPRAAAKRPASGDPPAPIGLRGRARRTRSRGNDDARIVEDLSGAGQESGHQGGGSAL